MSSRYQDEFMALVSAFISESTGNFIREKFQVEDEYDLAEEYAPAVLDFKAMLLVSIVASTSDVVEMGFRIAGELPEGIKRDIVVDAIANQTAELARKVDAWTRHIKEDRV
jgi:hypothetical protein